MSETGQVENTHAQKGASAQIAVRMPLSLNLFGTARKPQQIGELRGLRKAAPRLHACAIARFIFSSLSSNVVLILPRYLNYISINLDVGMFVQNLGSIRCLGAE